MPQPADVTPVRYIGVVSTRMDRRPAVWQLGEAIAARFLERRGVQIMARNQRIDGGEVDIVGLVGDVLVLVEVRTTTGAPRPDGIFPMAKRRRLRRLAGAGGFGRIDLVWVRLGRAEVWVDWIPGVSITNGGDGVPCASSRGASGA